MVVEGITASLRSMFWVFLLLAVILYTWAIYCVEIIGDKQAGYAGHADDETVINQMLVDKFSNHVYFGTLSRSMVSLFSVILLAEWSTVVRPIWEHQPGMVIVFIILVIVTTFVVLNVIIGVVVERTTSVMNQVRAKDVQKKKNEQMRSFETISELMFALDTDEDKRISR